MARALEYPSGVKHVFVDTFEDSRGFAEEFCFPFDVCRTLTVASVHSVIRGMHFQDWSSAPLTKVVTVTAGRIEEFVMDLRKDEPLEDCIDKYVLDSKETQYLIIPPWCAHGYAIVSDLAVVQYYFDAPRSIDAERIIHYATLPIVWPAFSGGPILSEKDRAAPPAVRVLAELRASN